MDKDDNLFEAFSDSDNENLAEKQLLNKKRTRKSSNSNPTTTDNHPNKEAHFTPLHKDNPQTEEDEDILLAKSVCKILQDDDHAKIDNDDKPEDMGMIIESFQFDGCVHENIREKAFKGQAALLKDPNNTAATKYPFKLDDFQERAILCLENHQSVLVAAHTSAGKTVVAQYAIAMALRDKQRVIYTSPIKALSNQKYRELASEFKDVGLMTGDVTLNPTASCIVMTTEILRNMLYKGSEITREMAWVIFDEVHYMRDKERGVVWEETIILLSNKINYVFLSATIPNAREFAMWISKLKNQPCNVVYTDYRPVPLQHYIYTAEADGIYLIVDANGKFREENFNNALETLNNRMKLENIFQKKNKKNQEPDIKKLVSLINSEQLNPCIVFSFSKKECEDRALKLAKMDLTTPDEKNIIETIYTNAIQTLAVEDQELDPIIKILPILKQGIGIHHGGMLPVIKECVELIFQEGLIKILFSTETFSMGINMPAKTVVFTSIEKWDGEQHRYLSGGEYIQMSGRAGRRGIDDKGITIMMLNKPIEPENCHNILKGISDPLISSFHLNYNQLVNLYRLEGMECEYIVKRSFRQFQSERSVPLLKQQIAKLHHEYSSIEINKDRETTIKSLLAIKQQIEQFEEEIRLIVVKPKNILPFLCPGRFVMINNWGYGIVVNFTKKSLEVINENKISEKDMIIKDEIENCEECYVVDILVFVKDHVDISSKLLPGAMDEKDYRIGVVPFLLQSIKNISPIKVDIPQNLKDNTNIGLVEKLFKCLITKFKKNPPWMDPIKDMEIEEDNDALRENMEKIRTLKQRQLELEKNYEKAFGAEISSNELKEYEDRAEIRKKLKKLIEEFYSIKKLVLQDELNSMKRVLRRLEFVKDDVVSLKGQIACNISSGDELLLTEMLFNGTFNDLSPEELASMLTCFLDTEGGSASKSNTNEDKIKVLYKELYKLHEMIKVNAKRVVEVLLDCKIEVNEEEYLQKFKDDYMVPVFEWASEKTFDEISSPDIYEGQLIRNIRRLDELLKQVSESAQQIGNFALKEKLEKASVLIRRGLPFAASLYLTN